MDQVASVFFALVASGTLTFVLDWIRSRSKSQAEVRKLEAETTQISSGLSEKLALISDNLLERLQKTIDRQDARLKDQDARITNLDDLVRRLTTELSETKVEAMKARRYAAALDYLVEQVKADYPVAIQITQKIAAGELILPQDGST